MSTTVRYIRRSSLLVYYTIAPWLPRKPPPPTTALQLTPLWIINYQHNYLILHNIFVKRPATDTPKMAYSNRSRAKKGNMNLITTNAIYLIWFFFIMSDVRMSLHILLLLLPCASTLKYLLPISIVVFYLFLKWISVDFGMHGLYLLRTAVRLSSIPTLSLSYAVLIIRILYNLGRYNIICN